MSEEELVRQCKKGDAKSQRQLFDMFSDRFFRLALRYVKNAHEAEDVVMTTFVKIFDNLKKFSYRDKGSLEAWMRKILVNEALMTLRRRHNFYLTETLDAENPEHDKEFFQDADAAYLYQLILELPDGYRTVFNLFAVEGYDHREIADLLGITESTSRSQLFKAKQLLKRKINREGLHYGT
ncbi:MAG: sigma-70 family RNA polymerase sigma factor [Cyclobacteriaceae bacterium]|nr:sigma-70 family RNA polymerase sigma factor [Cyclobacteriaceae bacterium]